MLSGVAGTLLARGLRPAEALALAAAAHGAAAARAAALHGTFSASDLERPLGAAARPVTRLRLEVDGRRSARTPPLLARALGASELWAVVKADGYGHGAVRSARGRARGWRHADRASRRSTRAGRCARRSAADVAIIVLGPLEPGAEARPTGSSRASRRRRASPRSRRGAFRGVVHVKADTGMGRWGLAPAEALALGRSLAEGALPGVELGGLMSHLATADAPDPSHVRTQTARFAELAAVFPPCPRHLANSAGALGHPGTRYDAARCGIALYGVAPDDGTTPARACGRRCASRAPSSRCGRSRRARARATAGG